MRTWYRSIPLWLGVLAVYLIIAFLKLPNYTILWLEVHNAGHTPLFGLLALFILGLSLNHVRNINRRWLHYLVAFLLASFFGLLLEMWQIWGPGDADINDLVRDMAGAFSFLAIYAMFDLGSLGTRERIITKGKMLIGGLGIVVLAIALSPLVLWSTAYILRTKDFPEIIAFESRIERKFARVQNASFDIVDTPAAWKGSQEKVGRLILKKGPYPGIAVRETYPDWRGYRLLKLEVFLTSPKPLICTLRIHDTRHNDDYHDRYNGQINLNPGYNKILINLSDVRNAPEKRQMNMKNIKSLMLFAYESAPACTLYIANIKLE